MHRQRVEMPLASLHHPYGSRFGQLAYTFRDMTSSHSVRRGIFTVSLCLAFFLKYDAYSSYASLGFREAFAASGGVLQA